jgi:hypothetical protein
MMRVSSVSIVPDYRLDNRARGVRSLGKAKTFPYSPVSGQLLGQPNRPCNGYGGGVLFPRGKAGPGCDADHSPPSSAEVKKVELHLFSPLSPAWQ